MTIDRLRPLRDEAEALLQAADRIDPGSITHAAQLLVATSAPVLVTGVGTSGIIARKIAATLTSTGKRAIFLHPSDAMHGQLGLVHDRDVLIAVSNSGETEEILAVLPYLRSRNAQIISIVGNIHSSLSQASTVTLDAGVAVEAGPHGLAPTSSTTLALAIGDTVAIEVMGQSGLTPDGFARNHPSGQLGRRLTLAVSDFGVPLDPKMVVEPGANLLDVLTAISASGTGTALVMTGSDLNGLVTDGDVRRAISAQPVFDPSEIRASAIMSETPTVIDPNASAFSALETMQSGDRTLAVLPIMANGSIQAIVRLHDLINAGL